MRRKFAMRAFQIPSYDGRHTASAVMGNFSVGIFRSGVRDDRELDAAWKWLKFLFRKRQQYAISFDYNFPAVKDLPCVLKERHPSFEPSLRAIAPSKFASIRLQESALGSLHPGRGDETAVLGGGILRGVPIEGHLEDRGHKELRMSRAIKQSN